MVNKSSKSSLTWDRTIPVEVIPYGNVFESDDSESSIDPVNVDLDGFIGSVGVSRSEGGRVLKCVMVDENLCVEMSQVFVVEWGERVFRVPEDLFLVEFNILGRGGRRGRETIGKEGFVLPVGVKFKEGL